MKKSKDEEMYILRYSKLMNSVGIVLAERVIQLIRHFYSAPRLQIFGYIVLFLQDEGLRSEHNHLIEELICSIKCQTKKTDHGLAMEIAKRKLPLPSYCLAYDECECVLCSSSLD